MTSNRIESVDLTSIESIVHSAYGAISGPAGAPRDWDTFRQAFHPSARLMPTRPTDAGSSTVEVFDVEGYITSRSAHFATSDFFEVEIARHERRFGNIASVLSAYESRQAPDTPPFMRGLNSFQMWWDGSRWWIMSILWDNEREGVALPESLSRGCP